MLGVTKRGEDVSALPNEPDVTEAIRKFLAMEDADFDDAEFDAFRRWCERRGPQYLQAVKSQLRLMDELPRALEDLMSSRGREGDS